MAVSLTRSSTRGLSVLLLGFAGSLLYLAAGRALEAIHQRHGKFPADSVDGCVLISIVFILSIAVPRVSIDRAWSFGLLAGTGFAAPLYLSALYAVSPHPRTWVWLLGWPMVWEYVLLASLILTVSFWAQCADFWTKKRRMSAVLVAAISVGLVVAIWAVGLGLMRSHFARSQAAQSSVTGKQTDVQLPGRTLTSLDGSPIPASDFQDHVTVIDFWGTWCAACIAEFPLLEAVHKDYSANANVRFLLADTERAGETSEKINHFLQRRPLSIPVARDPNGLYIELTEKLANNGVPLLIVVDRHGHIRFVENGFDSEDTTGRVLHKQVDTLLAAP
jgi:thiol-disulfide isomerase/thioredoxin